MSKTHESSGENYNNCHICHREMDNHSPQEGEVVDGEYVTYEKGIGSCPEHGISYDAVSMPDSECGHCSCNKDDCPVCSGDVDL